MMVNVGKYESNTIIYFFGKGQTYQAKTKQNL